jgi:amidase
VTDLANLDATAQAELVRAGEAQPIELVDAAIARIEALNDEINAVIHPLFDRGRALANGTLPDGPFRGVPIVVKDLDGTLAGAPYHGGNRLLKSLNYTPDTTSYLFAKLEAAGFVIVGKTNTPELGLMTSTEPQAHGPTHNPWDTTRTPGGSSGGSAAAVASGMIPVAHAGDGGGSIRIPSSMCGLFGLKPSRGRVSVGPDESDPWSGFVVRHVVTRSVRDSASVLDALQGYMPGDPYTAPPPARPYASELGADPGKLRIGIRTDTPGDLAVTDPACAAAAADAAALLESLGHTVEESSPVALDETDLMANFSTVMMSWVRAELAEIAQIAGRPVTADDVEPMTWLYHEMSAAFDGGAFVTSLNALQRWSRRVISWWLADGFDLLLTPTLAEPPPKLGDLGGQDDGGGTSAARSIPFAAYPAPFNVTGQPAMSVPLHWTDSEESRRSTPAPAGRSEANATIGASLPIGVQLVAAPFREDLLVRVASQLEAARPWVERRPPVHA